MARLTFEERLGVEKDMMAVVRRDILDKVERFSNYRNIHEYGGKGVRPSIDAWVKSFMGQNDEGRIRDLLHEFGSQVRDEFADQSFYLDIMMQFWPSTELKFSPSRLLMQGRVLSYDNYLSSTSRNWRSVTFSPEEYHNFRGHYFIHAYSNQHKNGLEAWIVFDFCEMVRLVGEGTIKVHMVPGHEFWWVPYAQIITAGLAIGYDYRCWGGNLSYNGVI